MKYYINKKTGTMLAMFNELMSVIEGNDEIHGGCMARVIVPERAVGNGVLYQIMHYSNIKTYYKRISKKTFFNAFGDDFGQLRHYEDNTIQRYNLKDVVKRKEHFGI